MGIIEEANTIHIGTESKRNGALPMYTFKGGMFIPMNMKYCRCGGRLDRLYVYLIDSLIEKKLLPEDYIYECCFCLSGSLKWKITVL